MIAAATAGAAACKFFGSSALPLHLSP